MSLLHPADCPASPWSIPRASFSAVAAIFKGNRLVTDQINRPPYSFSVSFGIETGTNGTLRFELFSKIR
jgi:hypothetical protein